MHRLAPALFLLAGCESGLATVVTVDVDDALAISASAASPRVLVTDAGPAPRALAPLCGEALGEPITYSYDHGFGCLDERKGTTEVLRAWVQPMPEGWDAAAFCALEPHAYAGLEIGEDVTGPAEDTDTAGGDTADDTSGGDDTAIVEPEALFPDTPDPSWPQASITAEWKRDATPCGGILRGELVVE